MSPERTKRMRAMRSNAEGVIEMGRLRFATFEAFNRYIRKGNGARISNRRHRHGRPRGR